METIPKSTTSVFIWQIKVRKYEMKSEIIALNDVLDMLRVKDKGTIYLFQVNTKNTRKRCEIWSELKLTSL